MAVLTFESVAEILNFGHSREAINIAFFVEYCLIVLLLIIINYYCVIKFMVGESVDKTKM